MNANLEEVIEVVIVLFSWGALALCRRAFDGLWCQQCIVGAK